ncbi:hypothetical protein OPV22_006248 [Ensete ventricosum]|uniref:Uncharacterized protein n=1 Tax=Ensete ventricosum TaxID=4639 RepID=A0AAV8Q3N1_ENSVE|nr:hypothetical protein OPV22_006248 [Ensete ventricosum]
MSLPSSLPSTSGKQELQRIVMESVVVAGDKQSGSLLNFFIFQWSSHSHVTTLLGDVGEQERNTASSAVSPLLKLKGWEPKGNPCARMDTGRRFNFSSFKLVKATLPGVPAVTSAGKEEDFALSLAVVDGSSVTGISCRSSFQGTGA